MIRRINCLIYIQNSSIIGNKRNIQLVVGQPELVVGQPEFTIFL